METPALPMTKSTEVEHPVVELITSRRSRRAYAARPVEPEAIHSLFEAARWAPSSLNEQPWAYLYATRDQPELWHKIFDALNEGNQVWAQRAPLLVLSMARKTLIRNGLMNGAARYDVGGANVLLSLQATQLGLNVHQMGGYDKARIIHNLNLPENYEPIVVMAIGYPGSPEQLSDNLKQREVSPRERYTQEFFVMNKPFESW
jgi:nitroreductase